MAEETIQKKSGAERQAAFLISALEKASQNDGVLLNPLVSTTKVCV